jgi:peptide deformylase
LINPEITWYSEEMVTGKEGCLSIPEVYDGVTRHKALKTDVLDTSGRTQEIEAEGLLAVCIQHEMDHLVGKVFVEYLSPLKKGRIKTKLLKSKRLSGKHKPAHTLR